MKTSYITQVPGGVWRCRPKEISQQVIRRKVVSLIPGSEKNKALVIGKLCVLGASCVSDLGPENYETFYKFLLTLE